MAVLEEGRGGARVVGFRRLTGVSASAGIFGVLVTAELVLLVRQMLRSTGFYWQDDLTHLLISRSVLHDASHLLDVWGRPMMTAAYVPAAAFGDTAARLTSMLILGLTAGLCYATVRRQHRRWPLAVVVLLLAEPLTFKLGYSALPQTVFGLVLAAAFYLQATNRSAWAACTASLLPPARLEGVVVLAVWAVFLLAARKWRLLPLLGVGITVWALAGAVWSGDVLWLLHSNPYQFLGSPYPRAGWLYGLGALATAGGWTAILAIYAVAHVRTVDRLALAIAVALGAFYSMVWGLPAEASIADPVYLVTMAVPLTLLAHHSVVSLVERRRPAVVGELLALAFVPFAVHAEYVQRMNLTHVNLTLNASVVLLLILGRLGNLGRLRPLLGVTCVAAAVAVLVHTSAPLKANPQQASARLLVHQLSTAQQAQVKIFTAPAAGWYAGRWQTVGLPGAERLPQGSVVVIDSWTLNLSAIIPQLQGWGYHQIAGVESGGCVQIAWQR